MIRVVQISAGRGPVEVRRFVAALAPALTRLLADRGLRVVEAEARDGSARLRVAGDADLSDLIGTHELVDACRGRGARRRWFAAVDVLEEAPPPARLDVRDVRFSADRAGGPGGQHVNTTSTAVRAVHLPTGLAVRVTDARSQHANRALALSRLAEALATRARDDAARSKAAARRLHDGVVRGAPAWRWTRHAEGLRPAAR